MNSTKHIITIVDYRRGDTYYQGISKNKRMIHTPDLAGARLYEEETQALKIAKILQDRYGVDTEVVAI
jgi:hypothetical protein